MSAEDVIGMVRADLVGLLTVVEIEGDEVKASSVKHFAIRMAETLMEFEENK